MSVTTPTTSIGGTQGTLVSKVPWGQVTGAVNSFLPQRSEYLGDKGSITAGMDSAYDTVSDSIMQVNPLIGGIMKGHAAVGKLMGSLGGSTDGMTTTDAILGSSLFAATPLGLVNGFLGSKSDTMQKDYKTQALVGSSYGGTYNGINSAMNKQGKKYGWFSQGAKNKANSEIWAAGRTQNMLGDLAKLTERNQQIANTQMNLASQSYLNDMSGNNYMIAAKSGAKLFSQEQLDRTSKLLNKPFQFNFNAFNDTHDVIYAKQGAKMNVIPEGSLHARKHEIFEENPELKGQITEKGIPVIVEKDGGEVEQQAEIELNEIIFIKSVTEKLEKYAKEYEEAEGSKKDEIAIKAGKLIAKQIMENTDDRTGLIDDTE